LFKKIIDCFRSIKYGIENLVAWFPIIWNDRDWDHNYLYVILRKKLSRMEYLQRNYGHSVEAERIAKQLKICKLLFDRLIKDKHADSFFDKHSKKWSKVIFSFSDVNKNNVREVTIDRTNIKIEKDKEKERKEFLRICEHENYLINQDIEYFCKLFRKHVRRWWD